MSLAPPYTEETAHQKVKRRKIFGTLSEFSRLHSISPSHSGIRDPRSIAKAYTPDTIWRNRHWFLAGTDEIVEFLTAKWAKEKNYKLRKELFAVTGNKIAVQFWYEYQDSHDGMKWKRCYGLEDWTFAEDGKMRKRQMSGNDVEISEDERWFKEGVDVNAVDISEKHW